MEYYQGEGYQLAPKSWSNKPSQLVGFPDFYLKREKKENIMARE